MIYLLGAVNPVVSAGVEDIILTLATVGLVLGAAAITILIVFGTKNALKHSDKVARVVAIKSSKNGRKTIALPKKNTDRLIIYNKKIERYAAPQIYRPSSFPTLRKK